MLLGGGMEMADIVAAGPVHPSVYPGGPRRDTPIRLTATE